MIAIGASIGTGLFLTSGQTISQAGALGSVIAYLIAGIAVFFVVHSLGEMAVSKINLDFDSYQWILQQLCLSFC